MRILKVADVARASPGGMNGFMLRGGRALADMGHEVEYYFRDDLPGVNVPAPARRLVVPWLIWWKIWHREPTPRIDVVEIHEPMAAAYCLMRKHVTRRIPPCAVLSYGTEERHWRAQLERWRVLRQRPRLKSRLLVRPTLVAQSRYALKNCNQALVPSDEDARYLKEELGVPTARISRVNTGVDTSFFDVERVANGEREQLRLLFVGSWIDRKGTREIAEAWSLVAEESSSVTLTLAGTILPTHEVLACFRTHGERIEVRARVSEQELKELLASHHVFILPAWFEGMPLSMLEAAAAGLACVVTARCGNVDVFRPADSESDGAILIPPHDGRALGGALMRLTRDRPLIRRLGENARRRARAFLWRHTARQSLEAYRKALASARFDQAGS